MKILSTGRTSNSLSYTARRELKYGLMITYKMGQVVWLDGRGFEMSNSCELTMNRYADRKLGTDSRCENIYA